MPSSSRVRDALLIAARSPPQCRGGLSQRPRGNLTSSHLPGRAHSTATHALFVVRSIFEDALEDGPVGKNPAKKVHPACRPEKQRTALCPEQVARLRSHLSTDRLYGCGLLTLFGLRRSEVMGLRWSDLDLNAGILAISRGRVLIDGKCTEEGKPEIERGARALPLPPDVLSVLTELKAAQEAAFGRDHVRSGYTAVNEIAIPLRPERWSDLWREHCAATGFQWSRCTRPGTRL